MFTEVTALSLPSKRVWEKYRRSSLEPFPWIACAIHGRSFFAATVRAGHGIFDLERSSLTFTAQKWIPGKKRTGDVLYH